MVHEKEDDFIVKQTWWHLEPILDSNKPAHKIRQVMDVLIPYTPAEKMNKLKMDLDIYFVGLKIFLRNDYNNEIAYLAEPEADNEITITLSMEKNMPSIVMNGNRFSHAKIEMEYIFTEPGTLTPNKRCDPTEGKNIVDKLWHQIRPNAIGSISYSGEGHPEFYITTPLGWEIEKDNHDSYRVLLLLNLDVIAKLNSELEDINTELSQISPSLQNNDDVEYQNLINRQNELHEELDRNYENLPLDTPVVIKTENNRKKYNFIPNKEGSKIFNQLAGSAKIKGIDISYTMHMSFLTFTFQNIPPILLALGVLLFLILTPWCTTDNYCASAMISYSVLLLAYFYTYIKMVSDGYYFTNKTMIKIALGLSGVIPLFSLLLLVVY